MREKSGQFEGIIQLTHLRIWELNSPIYLLHAFLVSADKWTKPLAGIGVPRFGSRQQFDKCRATMLGSTNYWHYHAIMKEWQISRWPTQGIDKPMDMKKFPVIRIFQQIHVWDRAHFSKILPISRKYESAKKKGNSCTSKLFRKQNNNQKSTSTLSRLRATGEVLQ